MHDRLNYALATGRKLNWFYNKLPDRGVELWNDCIVWSEGKLPRSKRFGDITVINPVVQHIPKHGTLYACQLSFADGTSLLVSSVDALGEPDTDLAKLYTRFLHDLHERLVQARTTVTFRSGVSERTYMVLCLLCALLVVAVVIGPVVAAIVLNKVKFLGGAAAGLVLCAAAFFTTLKAKPISYEPEKLPENLHAGF